MQSGETEVMVIDGSDAAASALSTYRPRHERTHLLCRFPGEPLLAFGRRVTRRLESIRRSAEVAALTLVLGPDASFSQLLSAELGPNLAQSLAPSGTLALVGVAADPSTVVDCLERFRDLLDPSVTLDAWFPRLDSPPRRALGAAAWQPPEAAQVA